MSGALMWEDEKANLPFAELGWFRAALAYRNSIILGQPLAPSSSLYGAPCNTPHQSGPALVLNDAPQVLELVNYPEPATEKLQAIA